MEWLRSNFCVVKSNMNNCLKGEVICCILLLELDIREIVPKSQHPTVEICQYSRSALRSKISKKEKIVTYELLLSQWSSHHVLLCQGFAGLAVYSGTKFFVEGLSRGMRAELANTGIRITCIQPGDVRTELLSRSTDQEVGAGLVLYKLEQGSIAIMTRSKTICL